MNRMMTVATVQWTGRPVRDEPSEKEQEESGGLDQAAAQIVENLPARDSARSDWAHGRRIRRDTVEGATGNLPVAAHPAMLAAVVGAVVRGIILDHLDVADQPGAGVGAFDQIVAEQGIAGEAARRDTRMSVSTS